MGVFMKFLELSKILETEFVGEIGFERVLVIAVFRTW